jgi:hypothetical protein
MRLAAAIELFAIKIDVIVSSREPTQQRKPSESVLVRLLAGLLFIRVSVYLALRTINRSRGPTDLNGAL